MRILLLGDYSNVHATLADGLRHLGHEVTVASDGDGWKNYPRDVDLRRPSLGRYKTARWMLGLWRSFSTFRGYDVVQLINPVFLPLRAERIWKYYRYLRRHNAKVFLGAFGMDYYYVKACLDCQTFRYSDFNFGPEIRRSAENEIWIKDWIEGPKGKLNRRIAEDADGIVAGLYEYYASYRKAFPEKLRYIPFPIIEKPLDTDSLSARDYLLYPERLRIFIGIQRARSQYKGTDIMLRAAERVAAEHPDECTLTIVEDLPFDEYSKLLYGSHVMLDQLYSYTPAMNALEAMSHGLVIVGGGEPENYDILGEKLLRPILNVEPTEESVYRVLSQLVEHRAQVPALSAESRRYIARHHNHVRVAERFVDFWENA
ncbi:MAG: glycosyltransferase family 1 protein [Prevotellaceae bacterium]|nr:glycosyltransferase family 1 protein [Prevotellaceae bacterium]